MDEKELMELYEIDQYYDMIQGYPSMDLDPYFEMIEGVYPLECEVPFGTGGRRRGRGGRIGQSNNTSRRNDRDDTQKFGLKKDIIVPSHKVGRIIGKGGCKIRNLEYESKANIKICDSTGSGTTITLSGTSEAILEVEGMINKLLEDRRPAPRKHFK